MATEKRSHNPWIGNIIASLVAFVVACVTIYASLTFLKSPQIPLDWITLFLSGLVVGIIAFFVTWGHFQPEPQPQRH